MQAVKHDPTHQSPPLGAAVLASVAGNERLLVVGDAAVPTGFARVIRSILEPLHQRFDIHHLAVNHCGDPHDYPWKLYPAAASGDVFGVDRLAKLLDRIQPRLLFLVNDLWNLGDYLEAIADRRPGPRIVLYCPIEAGPVDPRLLRRIAAADHLVLYTEFARREVESTLGQLRREIPDLPFPQLEVLAHGVDTDTFLPLHRGLQEGYESAVRAEVRDQVYPHQESLRDAFIVLNANRNQPRKRIDISMQGFALFAQDKPANVKLHLHMGMRDAGWDIPALARRYGIANRLLLTTTSDSMPALPSEQLNLLYNACDVGLNTATCEGWGLVSFEHAATGAAQVVPGFSAPRELWRGRAELLPAALTAVHPQTTFDEGIIDPRDVAAALERLYLDPAHLQDRSRAAYQHASRPEYQWDHLAAQWSRLLRGTLDDDASSSSPKSSPAVS